MVDDIYSACTLSGGQIPRGVADALYAAANLEHRRCVAALLDHGACANAGAPACQAKPLDGAVAAGNAAVVGRLLVAGARADGDKDRDGPLLQAVVGGSSEIVRPLLNFGARPDKLRRGDGKSPAMVAITTGPVGSVCATLRALFDYGAKFAPAGTYTTVLNEAIAAHNDTAVEWLVEHVDTTATTETTEVARPMYVAITTWTSDPRTAAIMRTLRGNAFVRHESDLCVAAGGPRPPTAEGPLAMLLRHGAMRHAAVQQLLPISCEAMNVAVTVGNIGTMLLLRLYGAGVPRPEVHQNDRYLLNRRTRAVFDGFIQECTQYTPIAMAVRFGYRCFVAGAVQQGCAVPACGVGRSLAFESGELAPYFQKWSRATHALHHPGMRSAARAFVLAMHRGGQTAGAAAHIPIELQLIVLECAMLLGYSTA